MLPWLHKGRVHTVFGIEDRKGVSQFPEEVKENQPYANGG